VDPLPNGRNVALGLVVTMGRAGRAVLLPARAVGALPFVSVRVRELASVGRDAELGARRRLEAATEDVLAAPEAERAVDHALAGPLPESVARALVQHRVVERVAREALQSGDFDEALAAALEHERTEQLVARILASREFEAVLQRVMSSPAVRAGLARQTVGFAGQIAAAVRRRANWADGAAERVPRAWFRRPPRLEPVPYGGLLSRGVALAVDAVLVTMIFVVAGALVGLISGLVGSIRPQWLVVTIAGVSWLLLEVAYFGGFWSLAGQTPGMRLMRLRVLGPTGAPPGLGRSLVRLAGVWLAIVPLFAGFLPVLVDDRRRALQDFIAGTVVVNDDDEDDVSLAADVAVKPSSRALSIAG
jgi:uncharacterized RDD family membrane protein YckC